MTRDAYTDRLLDLAYGELSRREAREVEGHAAACEPCRAELARIRETRRIMSALPAEPAPDRGEGILLAAAREAAERRRSRRLFPPWLWGAAAAAFSIAAVAAVSYRIIALRPGPLQRQDAEALLGESRYARPPPAAPQGEEGPAMAADRAAAEAEGAGESGALGAAPRERPRPAGEAPRETGRKAEAVRDEAPQETRRKAEVARDEAPPEEGLRLAEQRAAPAARADAPPPAAEWAAPRSVSRAGAPPSPAAGNAAAEARAADAERFREPAAAERPAAPSAALSRAPAPSSAPAALAVDRAAERAAGEATLSAAPLRAEARTFPGCEGEAVRRVEVDPRGRVVRYVREGRIGGRRLRVEHTFAPDGALAGVVVRDLDAPGTPLDAAALGLSLPERAADAGLDAPPRCGR